MTEHCDITVNPHLDRRGAYSDAMRRVVSNETCVRARDEMRTWVEYAPTPLRRLGAFARAQGLGGVWIKDESNRMGLSSFKALGGALAVQRVVAQAGSPDVTVACATDGNHGRAVAWGAARAGCACQVFVHEMVSDGRVAAIARFGATVTRIPGTYDDAVRTVCERVNSEGWLLVSDAADAPDLASCSILAGYGTLLLEVLEQLYSRDVPTHVMIPAGVGGLAAAICGMLWDRFGVDRPYCIAVEPKSADCVRRSLETGVETQVPGSLDTIMAGLACGVPSGLAWRILRTGLDAVIVIDDLAAVRSMRELALGKLLVPPMILGESGVAGLAGLECALMDPSARTALHLDDRSRVLVIGTEGATDPHLWTLLVGVPPHLVRGMVS